MVLSLERMDTPDSVGLPVVNATIGVAQEYRLPQISYTYISYLVHSSCSVVVSQACTVPDMPSLKLFDSGTSSWRSNPDLIKVFTTLARWYARSLRLLSGG